MPKGQPSLPYPRFALLHRAAQSIFKQTRKPRVDWKTIEDLAPQLAEFDLRYTGQDYDTAATVLLDIDFDHLFLWGHARRVVELHERLRGKLSDSWLNGSSLGNLGTAYAQIGRIRDAIECVHERSYVLRELLPSQDRLQLEHWHGKSRRLERVLDVMGKLVAWGHLRSGGRQRSATTDTL